MAVSTTLGVATFMNISEQKKRAEEVTEQQEELKSVEEATRAHQARKSRREQVREARVRQAEIENISAAGGATGSSAAIAAKGSLQSQLGTNVGEISTALALGSARSKEQQDIMDANRPSGLELVSGTALNIFS